MFFPRSFHSIISFLACFFLCLVTVLRVTGPISTGKRGRIWKLIWHRWEGKRPWGKQDKQPHKGAHKHWSRWKAATITQCCVSFSSFCRWLLPHSTFAKLLLEARFWEESVYSSCLFQHQRWFFFKSYYSGLSTMSSLFVTSPLWHSRNKTLVGPPSGSWRIKEDKAGKFLFSMPLSFSVAPQPQLQFYLVFKFTRSASNLRIIWAPHTPKTHQIFFYH